MTKRFIFFLLGFLALFAPNFAEAATQEVTAVSWGVSKDNILRIVLDCTATTDYEVALKDNELIITAAAKLNSKVSGMSRIKSNTANSMSVRQQGDKTVIKLPLKRKITSEDYRVFTLKKDPETKRPPRIIVDIADVPGMKLGAQRGDTVSTGTASFKFRTGGGISGKNITVDPGHGGSDPGAVGYAGTKEKDITLKIAGKVRDILTAKGAKVTMTRVSDNDVYGSNATDAQELQSRVDVAERNKADVFVSIHCNASTNREIGGMSTYYYPKTEYDKQIASSIQNKITGAFGLEDLGIRQAGFYVNKRSSMPTALVETAFLSNVKEEKLLLSNWFQTKMAEAIASGIENYFNGGGN